MILSCRRIVADFPAQALRLEGLTAQMVWDEHGGTFVWRAAGLETVEPEEPGEEPGIRLEMALPEPEAFSRSLAEFAGEHGLRLEAAAAGAELAETPLLAACHVPGKNLFIFCEEPRLSLRFLDPQTLEIRVAGPFKTRRVPSRETDIIIHLDKASMARLVAGMLTLSRIGP